MPATRWPLDRANVRFVVTFALTSAVLFGAYYFPYAEMGISEHWIDDYLKAYAGAVGWVLRAVEPGIAVTGNVVSGRFSMSIVKSCDAMEANMLFCAAVLALPGRWWRKGAALACGLALLVGLNVVRLCALYFTGAYFTSWFDVAHLDVWPLLMVGFATLDFFACGRWIHAEGASAAKPARPTHVAA